MAERPRQPFATTSGVPIAPISERIRDYSAVSGACGGIVGLCTAAALDAPLLGGFASVGATWATAAAAFVGVRHVLIHDAWEQDREGVSGIAGATVGCAGATLRIGPHVALQAAGAGFVAGFAGHYLHRLWLRRRLDRLELPGGDAPLFQSAPPGWSKAFGKAVQPEVPVGPQS